MTGRSDAELVQLLLRGDEAALAELYDRHAELIFRAALLRLGERELAEEVLQDTYLALWNRAELFDPASGSLTAWLSTIARNRAIDRLRALGRKPVVLPLSSVVHGDEGDEETDRAIASGEPVGIAENADPVRAVDEAWLRDEVRGALASMPAQERRVIELAYYGELTQSEIAARLGWPLGTVKTRTRRGLVRLRETLARVLGPDVGPVFAPVPLPGGPATPLDDPSDRTAEPTAAALDMARADGSR